MKKAFLFFSLLLAISLSSCTQKGKGAEKLSTEDSLKLVSDIAYKAHLAELQKIRENFIGPDSVTGGSVKKGDRFTSSLLNDSLQLITAHVEKLMAKMEAAQKDSTTLYGALLTRFRQLKTQHKYLTATYDDQARLLRFTSEVSFDDKHEEDRDFYFDNDTVVYFRFRKTSTSDDQDIMTDDSYFFRNGKIVYSYRDEGETQMRRDKMDVINTKRYKLDGNQNGQVAKEFEEFKKDYDILLLRPLEPLIYPVNTPSAR